MDSDAQGRLILCINVLTQPNHPARNGFIDGESKKAFARLLEEQNSAQLRTQSLQGPSGIRVVAGRPKDDGKPVVVSQVDDLIRIRQLTAMTRGDSAPDEEDEDGAKMRDEVAAISKPWRCQ